MPGAPNSPPKNVGPAAPAVDGLERKVLRRLAPARLALRLDVWKGAPSKDLIDPFGRAESHYEAGEYREADSALDQLSVRFAEPRWPTIPEPFRSLRVRIPAPMPPHYDPEFSLGPDEKESRRRRREAELQLALAKASVEWARAHGTVVDDLPASLSAAEAALAAGDVGEGFWTGIDAIWVAVRARVPVPGAAPKAPAGPAPSAAAPALATEPP